MAFETPGLSALRKKCTDLPLESKTRVLVISSPIPEMVVSSALLCRALRKSGLLFHLVLGGPVMDSGEVAQIVDRYPEYLTVLVGIESEQGSQKEPRIPSVISIGVTPEKGKKSRTVGDRFNAPASAYAIAVEKALADREEMQLAVQGTILGSMEHESDPTTSELIAAGIKSGVVLEAKGFLMFGMNLLSISETFQYSIDPYIHGFSGNRPACERLIDQSGIPLSMRSSPLTRLSKEEKQKLNANLIPQVPQNLITKIMGQNYEFPHEKTDSPVRFLSQIRTLIGTACARQQIGLAFGVLIGDRARVLKQLVDLYIQHSQSVLDGMKSILSQVGDSQNTASDTVTVLPCSSASRESLPDLARVMIENEYVKSRFAMVLSQNSVGIAWNHKLAALSSVLVPLRGIDLRPVSTSVASLRIDDCTEEKIEPIRTTLEKVSNGPSEG